MNKAMMLACGIDTQHIVRSQDVCNAGARVVKQGQHVLESAVRVTHLPSKLEVSRQCSYREVLQFVVLDNNQSMQESSYNGASCLWYMLE